MNTPAPFPAPSLSVELLDSFVAVEYGGDGPLLMPLAELTRTDAPAEPHGVPSVGASWVFARRGRHLDPLVTVDGGPSGPALIPLAELTHTR